MILTTFFFLLTISSLSAGGQDRARPHSDYACSRPNLCARMRHLSWGKKSTTHKGALVQEIIYGSGAPTWEDDAATVVFASPEAATRNALLNDSARQAKVWGDFARAIGTDEWSSMVELFESAEYDIPSMDEEFSIGEIPGYEDGDWPPWIEALQLELLPKEIVGTYGELVRTTLNGDAVTFKEAECDAIVAALTEQGFVCRRDDDLIQQAISRE